jgi:hypothetical protein
MWYFLNAPLPKLCLVTLPNIKDGCHGFWLVEKLVKRTTDNRHKVMGKAHFSLQPWWTKYFLENYQLLPCLDTIGPVVSGKKLKFKSLQMTKRDGHQVMIIPHVNFSHFDLFNNHWVKLDQTLLWYFLNAPLPKLCPVTLPNIKDGWVQWFQERN